MESLKQKAIRLRLEGYSYTYINAKTGLSKSTLSYHLATIPYVPNSYTKTKSNLAQQKSAETKHQQKMLKIGQAKKWAESKIKKLNERDILIAGIALYAGEGSKTNNLVRLVNADPSIIKFFIKWLAVLGVPKENIVVRIHAYPDTDLDNCFHFWSKETGLTKSQFQSPCIDYRVNKDRRRSAKHNHGTAHVTVRANGNSEFGTKLSRKIDALLKILFH